MARTLTLTPSLSVITRLQCMQVDYCTGQVSTSMIALANTQVESALQVWSMQAGQCLQTISNAHGPSASPSYAGLVMGLLPYQVCSTPQAVVTVLSFA